MAGRKSSGRKREVSATRLAPLDPEELNDPERAYARYGPSDPDEVEGAFGPPESDDGLYDKTPIFSSTTGTRRAPAEPEVPSNPGFTPSDPDDGFSNRTTFSNQAVMFADMLRNRFADRMYGRNPRRILRVDEPDGPSTAGGLLARQSLSLVARKGTAPSIVFGWLDVSKREALLRGYDSVASRHEARHGYALDLPRQDYNRFIEEMLEMLDSGQFRVRMVELEPREPKAAQAQAKPQSSSLSGWTVLLLLAFAFAGGLLVEHKTQLAARLLSQAAANETPAAPADVTAPAAPSATPPARSTGTAAPRGH